METMLIILAVITALVVGWAVSDWAARGDRRQLRQLRRRLERLQAEADFWRRVPVVVLLAGLLLVVPTIGNAATVNAVYDFDVGSLATNCGGSCGTVSVSGDTSSAISFSATLIPGAMFSGFSNGSPGTGGTLGIGLSGVGISFSDLGPSVLMPNSYAYTMVADPSIYTIGGMPFTVLCATDPDGKHCNSPISFTAHGTDLALAVLPFVAGINFGGIDGLVSASLEAVDPAATPLPSALILFGSVLVGAAGLYRSRRKKPAVSAAVPA